ncbi:hypothetical protein FACS1894187_05560 [Synergistales bacterium]|nr:hypothetical protein FACS1894187_05560 [Synergistales bacterium]
MVYIISANGNPLMPTTRHGKVRRLLKKGKAKVVQRTPFTIQLLYETTEYTQPITLAWMPEAKPWVSRRLRKKKSSMPPK